MDGRFYRAIQTLYRRPVSCVEINEMFTDWFETSFGVKQGDILSQTLSALFVNDSQIKESNLGVCIGDIKISILLYADDIILLAESESDLQNMLNMVRLWCYRWRSAINKSKTQIMHFRKKVMERSTQIISFVSVALKYVSVYKYLGFFFDEFMIYEAGIQSLTDSAGRALGSVINKMKVCNDLGYCTYTKLYDVCVSPILNYALRV